MKAKTEAVGRSPGWLGQSRQEWIFILFLLLFCTLFVLVERNNHKLYTNDFRVYFDATHDFFAGNNPYRHAYGLETGFFKYAPFTLYLFAPQLVVSYGVGQVVHLSLLAFSLIFSLLALRRLIHPSLLPKVVPIPAGWLYLAFACAAIHLTRELHMGNVNLLLLFFFVVGLRSLLKGNDLSLAAWWSLMLVLKPIMILVLLPLLVYRKWRSVVYMGCFGLLFLVAPILHVGWTGTVQLWYDWLKAIGAHGEYLTSFNAIGTMAQTHWGIHSFWIVPFIVLGLLSAGMVGERLRFGNSAESLVAWIVVFAAFIPNFFVTDTEHFLLSLPLIFFLISELLKHKKWYYWMGFVVGMLLFAFNSNDLLGSKLSDFVYDNGFLGIGNLLFVMTFLLLRFRSLKYHSNEVPV